MPLNRSTLNHAIFIVFLILVFHHAIGHFADNIQFHKDIQTVPGNTHELGHHNNTPEIFQLNTTKPTYRNAAAHPYSNLTTLPHRNSTGPAYSSATDHPHIHGTGHTPRTGSKHPRNGRTYPERREEPHNGGHKGGNKNGGGTTNNCYNCTYEDKAAFESADDRLMVGMSLLALFVGWFV